MLKMLQSPHDRLFTCYDLVEVPQNNNLKITVLNLVILSSAILGQSFARYSFTKLSTSIPYNACCIQIKNYYTTAQMSQLTFNYQSDDLNYCK